MSPWFNIRIFRKEWGERHGHLPEPKKHEVRRYLDTSARVNSHLPKREQIRRAADMAADDQAMGSPEGF